MRTALRRASRALVLCLLVLAVAPAGAATDARAAFERGVEASREGDHAAAVRHFEAARRAGLDTGALHFNLGVAYYRTGRIEAADAAFERAAASESMAAPALYQLGRMARDRDELAEAGDYFRRAARRARTERLRRAARNALAGVTVSPPDYVYVETGVGHDSNVALNPADAAGRSRESAAFVDGYAAVRRPIDGRTYLRGSAYLQHFPSASEFDLLSIAGGIGRVGRLDGGWRWDARVDLRHQRFDGDPFETALLPGLRLERRVAPDWTLALAARLALARGGTDYGYLDGTGQRLRVILDQPGAVGWRFALTLERVDRDDLGTGDDFFSFSRDELALAARRGFRLGSAGRLALEADWTRREYDGTEVRDGTALGAREEDRLGLGVEWRRALDDHWTLAASLRVEERDANIDAFDYERELVAVRLDRLF